VPKLTIPLLVDLYADGRLPLDRLVTHYPLGHINEAVADTESGAAVKAVLHP
jgi:aryl-alcohol dehydrogenase